LIHVKESAIRCEVEKGSPVKILLTDTDRRAYAARLAMAFAARGCEVSIVCTDHHPIENIRAPHRRYPYHALRPLNSLRRAIESTLPDFILPCDDRAVQHLHQLSRQCWSQAGQHDAVARLIERSLGPPSSYPIVSTRYALLQLAQAEGIRVPATCLLQTPEDLLEWQAKQPFPWVLKADGTWGGSGVRITESLPDAQRKFHALRSPCGLSRALKRALVNRDSFYFRAWWEAFSPAVIAQAFVPGRPANCAVACWEGKVLAQMNVEVLATSSATGPANVVRRVDNPEMLTAAERIARRMGLSGLFGLDFIAETGSGATYLLEMNPRCTPLCHIQVGSAPDLVAALHSHLAGRSLPKRPASAADGQEVIAYYPHVWKSNGDLQKPGLQDFPLGEPELARALLQPFPEGTLLYRIMNYLSETPLPQGHKPASTIATGALSPERASVAAVAEKL
jgi:ATP-grasp domain